LQSPSNANPNLPNSQNLTNSVIIDRFDQYMRCEKEFTSERAVINCIK
jgi:hypothetical protein